MLGVWAKDLLALASRSCDHWRPLAGPGNGANERSGEPGEVQVTEINPHLGNPGQD